MNKKELKETIKFLAETADEYDMSYELAFNIMKYLENKKGH